MLAVFDSPLDRLQTASARPRSTMPLQSPQPAQLDVRPSKRAEGLAARLAAEHPGETARLSAAFLVTLGRPATESQLTAAKELLRTQKSYV